MKDLNFVTHNADGSCDLWTPAPSGEYAAGCAAGRAYADELIQHARNAADGSATVAAVLREITRKGTVGAVEIGFFQRIGVSITIP